MARDNSLVYSIKDYASQSLIKISENMQKNRKEIQNLSGKIDELNKKKATVTVDAAKAKQELKAAQKEFAAAQKSMEGMDEAAERLEKAQYNYSNITDSLKSISKESKEAEKSIQKLEDQNQKLQNRAYMPQQSLLSKLGQAGATQLVGQVASEAAGAYIASAFGSETSTMLSSMLSMGASGAALGSVYGPVGVAIGAGAGALLGSISGATQNFQNQDEYFKSLTQEKYNQYQQEMTDSLTGGSETAASKEQSRLAFSTLLGSDAAAEDFLRKLQTMAANTPFSQTGLETIAKNLIANGISDTEEQLAMMNAVGEAGSALGLSEESMADVATYLGRMNSTGKTSLEYLTPLMERGIPAVDYLAENLGKSKEEVYDMVSKGLIPGAEAARIIAAAMGEDFSGSLEKQAQTYNGLMSTLSDAREQLDAAMGEGYNEARKSAIQKEIDYLSGEGGEQMKEMYSLIGEFQASVENAREEAIRNAMIDVQKNNKEYRNAELAGDGATMGRLLMEAKSAAEQEYLESEEYDLLYNAQKSSITSVRDNLRPVYEQAGYALMQEFNKGLMTAQEETEDILYGSGFFAENWTQLGNRYRKMLGMQPVMPEEKSHASGLMYVPYDDYPARLHEGERVLTAREARSYGGGVQVSVTGNNFTVREEADIDRIAETIARKVVEAKELAAW